MKIFLAQIKSNIKDLQTKPIGNFNGTLANLLILFLNLILEFLKKIVMFGLIIPYR